MDPCRAVFSLSQIFSFNVLITSCLHFMIHIFLNRITVKMEVHVNVAMTVVIGASVRRNTLDKIVQRYVLIL